jgi:hypothetical protein
MVVVEVEVKQVHRPDDPQNVWENQEQKPAEAEGSSLAHLQAPAEDSSVPDWAKPGAMTHYRFYIKDRQAADS